MSLPFLVAGDNRRAVRSLQLHQQFDISLNAVKQAIFQLRRCDWLKGSQTNKHDPIMMRIINPIQVLLDTIHKQLEDAPSRGEGLARAWLTALIDSRNYDDGSFPEYLGNPDTGFALQFDRIYHEHKVAFEFNGPQHDHPTKRYNAATVAKQKRRDLHRRQICKSENITLIELTAVDLSKEGMLSKIAGTPLPLRELVDLHIVTDYLENLSRRYQEDCIYAQL